MSHPTDGAGNPRYAARPRGKPRIRGPPGRVASRSGSRGIRCPCRTWSYCRSAKCRGESVLSVRFKSESLKLELATPESRGRYCSEAP